jgi:hypothetical protein
MLGNCMLMMMILQVCMGHVDANQGVGHANHTCGNGAEFAQDPLSHPSSPVTSGAEFAQDHLSLLRASPTEPLN